MYTGASDLSLLHGHVIPSEKGVYDSFTLRIFCFQRDKGKVLRSLLPASVHLICLSFNIISIRGLPWWLRQ